MPIEDYFNDTLMTLENIDEAETILDYIKNPNYDLLRRKIDLASITGRLQETCNKVRRHFNSSDILKFKIICLAREGDWNAAAILFSVGSTLKLFSSTEKKLLLNFLDPEINVKIAQEEIKKNPELALELLESPFLYQKKKLVEMEKGLRQKLEQQPKYSLSEFKTALRCFKYEEFLRITVRDLAELCPFEETLYIFQEYLCLLQYLFHIQRS